MKVATLRASFGDVDAWLVTDGSGLRLEGAARVESVSIADPPEFREHVVRGAESFDAENHPEITFRSQRVELPRMDGDGDRGADELGSFTRSYPFVGVRH
jgi:polyisoprenoid-binding protein YceI